MKAINAFLLLMDYHLRTKDLHPAILGQTLHAAQEALSNCQDRFYSIDVSVDHARHSLLVLEKYLKQSSSGYVNFSEVVHAGLALMEPVLKPVGGCVLTGDSGEQNIAVSRSLAIAVLSTTLSLLGSQLAVQALSSGIRLLFREEDHQVGVRLSADGLTEQHFDYLATALIHQFSEIPTLSIRGTGQSIGLDFLKTTLPDLS